MHRDELDNEVLQAIQKLNRDVCNCTYTRIWGQLPSRFALGQSSLDKSLQRLRKAGKIVYQGQRYGWVATATAVEKEKEEGHETQTGS